MNIKDIAREAGVSISTVSRVINHQAGVQPPVREKVQAIIQKNGFTPNLLARGLVQKRSRTVGVILPYVHSHWMERINGIMDYCQEHHYSVMFNTYQMDWKKEKAAFQFMLEKQVDGVIYFPDKNLPRQLSLIRQYQRHFPLVITEQKFSTGKFDQVIQDNYSASIELMNYFISLGHRDIALLCGPLSDYSAQERLKGYTDALKEQHISFKKALIHPGQYSLQDGYRLMKDILSGSSPLPSAVFAMNDLMALGALRAIQESGLQVPGDISLAGYDDTEMAAFSYPSLSTVRQENYPVGTTAARLLLDRIEDPSIKPGTHILKQSLIFRESIIRREA